MKTSSSLSFAFSSSFFQSGEYPRLSSSNLPQMSSRSKGPVLHIPNVSKDDAGTYICTASNGVGSMSADQIELMVLCKSPPTLLKFILLESPRHAPAQ